MTASYLDALANAADTLARAEAASVVHAAERIASGRLTISDRMALGERFTFGSRDDDGI